METPEERAARRKRMNFLCNATNPEALQCRLFVSMDTSGCDKRELVAAFSEYGRVFDLAIHKNYMFVQYGCVEDAQKAVNRMDNQYFKGRYKMGAKLAVQGGMGRKEEEIKRSVERCRFFAMGQCNRGASCHFAHDTPKTIRRSPSPRRRIEPRHLSPPPKRLREDPFLDRRHEDPLLDRRHDDPLLDRRHDDPLLDRRRAEVVPFAEPSVGRLKPRFADDGFDNPYLVAAPPRRPEPAGDNLRPPYDCVIITGTESVRPYCDLIDRSLRKFGMLTNIQVVDGEHLPKRAVEEAALHRVPYTICVTPNNQEFRSVTLNILHGVPQEHRNMPLDDSMMFLSRNFDQYVEEMKKKIAASEWVPPTSSTCYLLNLLADGRRLSAPELQEVLDYVQTTLARVKSVSEPLVSVPAPLPEQNPPRVYHEESPRGLLGKNPGSGTMADLVTNRTPKSHSQRGLFDLQGNFSSSNGNNSANSSSINFSNPAVKKALDDLLEPRQMPQPSNYSYY